MPGRLCPLCFSGMLAQPGHGGTWCSRGLPGAGGGVGPEWPCKTTGSNPGSALPPGEPLVLSEPVFPWEMQLILPVLEGVEGTELGDPWEGLGAGLGTQ